MERPFEEWVKEAIDEDKFRVVYNHPGIIKCKDCDFMNDVYSNGDFTCSNMYSYPNVPVTFGCKNGRVKRKNIPSKKVNLKDKIKCKLGFHSGIRLGIFSPYSNEILLKCDNCNKYGIYNTDTHQTVWIKKEDKDKWLHKSCIEMIDKYNL